MLTYSGSKFKLPTSSISAQQSPSTAANDHVASSNKLGSFAKMMLDATDIAFRCRAYRFR